jgi:hypothetical protein
MTVDSFPDAGPELRKAPPAGARPTARQLLKELSGPVDERFKQSLAGLSHRLGERVAGYSPDDRQAAAEARRAALQAYDLERAHRLKLVLSAVGGIVVAAGIAWFVIDVPPVPSLPRLTASLERAHPSEGTAVAPAPPPPAVQGVSATVREETPIVLAPVASAPVEPSPEQAPLRRDEVREVQTKLRSFGFNPGPLDGAAGPMTLAAVGRYQQDRGQQQTSTVDRDLLEQLRQDPAPPVAAPPPVAQRVAQPSPSRPTNSSGTRSSDPFEPFRNALDRFDRWAQGR